MQVFHAASQCKFRFIAAAEPDGFSYTRRLVHNGPIHVRRATVSYRCASHLKSGIFSASCAARRWTCRWCRVALRLLNPPTQQLPRASSTNWRRGMTPEPIRATEDVLRRVQGEFL